MAYGTFRESMETGGPFLGKSKKNRSCTLSCTSIIFILLLFILICIIVAIGTFFGTKSAFCNGNDSSESENQYEALMKSGPSAEELRLPQDLYPIFYDWTVKTYLPYKSVTYPAKLNLTFDGKLEILFHCVKDTDKITLNQNGLNFTKENFQLFSDNANIILNRIEIRPEVQMVDYYLRDKLKNGHNYTVKLDYRGPISGEVLSGLYRSHYIEKGKTSWLAITQFSPADARRALPCFDEPSMKAQFQTTVIHPKETTAHSNGLETLEKQDVSNSEGSGWVKSSFAKSPKMSTYLLALAVTNYDYTQGYTQRGTRFRIWARRSMLNQTKYALDAGTECLTYYEDYFGIPFPMPKQDMMAVPDFKFGAMENWGLITYREKAVLYDPTVYGLSDKQYLASIIAHELGHQWFGNLATMKWWDDLWLKEGFASYLEYIGGDFISDNKLHMKEQIVIDAIQTAMARDQLASSHPLYVPLGRLQDVYENFDSISYNKGSAIIYMVNNVVGDEIFKHGLKLYLNKYKYSNADHNDLWNSLSEAVFQDGNVKGWDGPLNISAFTASWTLQMGFPVIRVIRQSKKIIIEQKRFKLDQNAKEKPQYQTTKFGYKWHIPLWYKIGSGSERIIWLTPKDNNITLPEQISTSELLLLNNGVLGYYRVMYDQSGWNTLTTQLGQDYTKIPAPNRAQLIDDAFTLARANMLSYDVALKLTEYLGQEDNYLGWQVALSSLGYIKRFFESEAGFEYLRNYFLNLVLPLYRKTSWDLKTDDVFVENLAKLIIRTTCSLDSTDCVRKAKEYSNQLVQSCPGQEPLSSACNKIRPFLRNNVYCTSIKEGDTVMWNYIWEKYLIEQVQVEKDRLLYSLGCTNKVWLLNKLLELSIEGTSIRKQDVHKVWSSVANQPIGKQIIWDFFVNHWDKIYENFGQTTTLIKRIISSSTDGMKKKYQLKQIEMFRKANPNANKFSVFDSATEIVKSNIVWMDKNYENLEQWFKNKTAEN